MRTVYYLPQHPPLRGVSFQIADKQFLFWYRMVSSMAATILVTGGTGLLGRGIKNTAPQDVRIISVHQRDYSVADSRAELRTLDLRDKGTIDRLFASSASTPSSMRAASPRSISSRGTTPKAWNRTSWEL